jgi:Zn-dependent protease/predicted transcriptional regulator
MMQANIKLGRIFGIEVGLHYSWLIIALLVTLSLTGHFRATNPQWGAAVVWATAIATALLFFASIVAHELSHAAVAKANGLPVKSITLFALGGVALIGKEAEDAKTEFWMGIVGPIASAVIGFACLGLLMALGWTTSVAQETPLRAMLMWLGVINIVLAIFNMIPGFPLDGGRVLRAIVWWVTGDAVRATRIATRAGSVAGFGLIIVGILRFFGGAGFGGLWLVFIGWFLLDAARASRAYLETSESLRGVRVADVMAPNCPVIDSRDNLQTFVDEHLLRSGHRCFVVEEQGRISGIITLHELKGVDRTRWPNTTVDSVMLPLEKLHTVDPHTLVTEALEMMGREDVNQLPVVLNGSVAGIITRGDVLRLLQTRAELQTMRSS